MYEENFHNLHISGFLQKNEMCIKVKIRQVDNLIPALVWASQSELMSLMWILMNEFLTVCELLKMQKSHFGCARDVCL